MVLFLLHQVIGTPAKEVIIGAELFVFYFYILTVLLYIPFVYDSVATETTERREQSQRTRASSDTRMRSCDL